MSMADKQATRVWDLPTRVFHWALVIAVAAAIVTVKIGGDAMTWHFRCGYVVLGLMLFRLMWGFFGTRYARFTSFPVGWNSVRAYLRGERFQGLGHNPLGSLSVLTMLVLLSLQATSGLFTSDEIDSEGPLAKHVSSAWSEHLSFWHADINAVLIYAMLVLHVVALLYYRFMRHERLVGAMFSGRKTTGLGEAGIEETWRTRLLGLLLACLSALLVYLLIFI